MKKLIIFAIFLILSSCSFAHAQIAKRETARGFSQSEILSATLSNSTSETNLYSLLVPANKMGDSKVMNFRLTLVMNSVLSVPTLTIKVKLGAGSITLLSSAGVNLNVTNRPIIVEGFIANATPTSQKVAVWVLQSGILSAANGTPSEYAEWSIDTTTDQTFLVTGQFSGLSLSTTLSAKQIDIDAT